MKPGRPKGTIKDDKYKAIGLRLPPELLALLKEVSKESGINRSKLIVDAVRQVYGGGSEPPPINKGDKRPHDE